MRLETTVQTGQSSFSHKVLETAYVSRACEGQGLLQSALFPFFAGFSTCETFLAFALALSLFF